MKKKEEKSFRRKTQHGFPIKENQKKKKTKKQKTKVATVPLTVSEAFSDKRGEQQKEILYVLSTTRDGVFKDFFFQVMNKYFM